MGRAFSRAGDCVVVIQFSLVRQCSSISLITSAPRRKNACFGCYSREVLEACTNGPVSKLHCSLAIPPPPPPPPPLPLNLNLYTFQVFSDRLLLLLFSSSFLSFLFLYIYILYIQQNSFPLALKACRVILSFKAEDLADPNNLIRPLVVFLHSY